MSLPLPGVMSALRAALLLQAIEFAACIQSPGALPPQTLPRLRHGSSAPHSRHRQPPTAGGSSHPIKRALPAAVPVTLAGGARSVPASGTSRHNAQPAASYHHWKPLLDAVLDEAHNVAHASADSSAGKVATAAREPAAGRRTKARAAELHRALAALRGQLHTLKGAFGNTKQQGDAAHGREDTDRADVPKASTEADVLLANGDFRRGDNASDPTPENDEDEHDYQWLMERQQNLTKLIIRQADAIVNASLDLLEHQELYNASVLWQEQATENQRKAHSNSMAQEERWWEQEGLMQQCRQYKNMNESQMVALQAKVKEDTQEYMEMTLAVRNESQNVERLKRESNETNESLLVAETSYSSALAAYSVAEKQEKNATDRLQVAMSELNLRHQDFSEGHQRLLELRRQDEPPHDAPASAPPMALLSKDGHASPAAPVAAIEQNHKHGVEPLDYDKVEGAIDDLFTDVEEGDVDKNSSVPRAAVALQDADKASEPPAGLGPGTWTAKDTKMEMALTSEVQKLALAEHDASEHVMSLSEDLAAAQGKSESSYSELNKAHESYEQAREESTDASRRLAEAEQRYDAAEENQTALKQALLESQDELVAKAEAYRVAYHDYREEQAKLNNITVDWQIALDVETVATQYLLEANISLNMNASLMRAATDRVDEEVANLNLLNEELVSVQCELYQKECASEEEEDDDSEDGPGTWVIILTSFAILAALGGIGLMAGCLMRSE